MPTSITANTQRTGDACAPPRRRAGRGSAHPRRPRGWSPRERAADCSVGARPATVHALRPVARCCGCQRRRDQPCPNQRAALVTISVLVVVFLRTVSADACIRRRAWWYCSARYHGPSGSSVVYTVMPANRPCGTVGDGMRRDALPPRCGRPWSARTCRAAARSGTKRHSCTGLRTRRLASGCPCPPRPHTCTQHASKPEHVQQLLVRDDARVELNLHRLGVVADAAVRGVRRLAARVPEQQGRKGFGNQIKRRAQTPRGTGSRREPADI